MSKRINKFFFWLFLHTPERLKRFYPQTVIDRIGQTARKEIDCMQSDIIRQKWQLITAQQKLKELKHDPDNNI